MSGDFELPTGVRPAARFADAWHWQKLIGALSQLAEVTTGSLLLDLESRIRRWYQAGGVSFSWTDDRQESATASTRSSSAGRVMRLESNDQLAEDILLVLRQGLIDGTFSGESEISMGKLSRVLGVPVRDVRPAVRALTEHGLVTAARSDSVVVRIPSLDDVSEAYMARRALGAIAVRAASRWSPEGRSLVKNHLDELCDCVRRNDMTKAHYVDMDFQIALFEASGLSRIPAMLETLTKQAFMHFAVIGARYAFSPKRILEGDTEIFEAISAGDLRAATLSWQSKMDEGLQYIAHHISAMDQRNDQESDS
jgi:DNA-binding GntR family transcriptional regulator